MPVVNYHTVNGQLVGQSTGTEFTQYLTDALGSVTATVNGKRVTNTYRYKPYGERLAKTGTGPDPAFQWAGDTGSRVTGRSWAEQYNQARHYGTRQSSWTSVDAIWPMQSAYLYASSSPTVRIDPQGNLSCIANRCSDIDMNPSSAGCPFSRCQAPKTVGSAGCPGRQELLQKCKTSRPVTRERCQNLVSNLRIAIGIGSGNSPGSDNPGTGQWQYCTSCCEDNRGQRDYRTLCCTGNPSLYRLDPCVQYCLLHAHEEIGHGARQCKKIGSIPRVDMEKDPNLCFVSCISQVIEYLGCRKGYPDLFNDPNLNRQGSCDSEDFLKLKFQR